MVYFAGGLLADRATGARVVPHHMAFAAAVPDCRNRGGGSFCFVTRDLVPAGTRAPRTSRDLGLKATQVSLLSSNSPEAIEYERKFTRLRGC